MKKVINDSVTLFLFNILKLLCSNFLYIYVISYINVTFELCGGSHLRATVYKFNIRMDLTLLYFSPYLCFLYYCITCVK